MTACPPSTLPSSPPPPLGTTNVYSLAPGDRHPWVGSTLTGGYRSTLTGGYGSMYIDYCRAFTIAATGGVVIIPSGKDERCSAAMMLGSDDGLSARGLNGDHYHSKPDVEARVEALLGTKGVKVAA